METKIALEKDTVETLQDLIQVNIDSRDGFLSVVEHTEDESISRLFRELASRRNEQASELSSLVELNDEQANNDGSMMAAAHRGWIDLRGRLGESTTAMLEEAERGEDQIKHKYEEALKTSAGSAVTDVLNRQYRAVKEAHDRVRDLRDIYRKK